MTRPATVDPVPFLARQLADWLMLSTVHRRGVAAAVEAMNSAGGRGRGEDGVWRCWDTINAGRHKVSYSEADRPTVVVGTRWTIDPERGDDADNRVDGTDDYVLILGPGAPAITASRAASPSTAAMTISLVASGSV